MTAHVIAPSTVFVIEIQAPGKPRRFYTGLRNHTTWAKLLAKTPERALRYESHEMAERDRVNHCTEDQRVASIVRAVPAERGL